MLGQRFNWTCTEKSWRWVIGVVCAMSRIIVGSWWGNNATLSATELMTIEEAEISLEARMDTGATISSINARDLEVIGGGGSPHRSDKGKQIRFTCSEQIRNRFSGGIEN